MALGILSHLSTSTGMIWVTLKCYSYHARTSIKYLYGCKYAAHNKQFKATFSLTQFFPWHLVKSLTFPWKLSNFPTFPGFSDKWSPWVQHWRQSLTQFYTVTLTYDYWDYVNIYYAVIHYTAVAWCLSVDFRNIRHKLKIQTTAKCSFDTRLREICYVTKQTKNKIK